MFSELLLQVLQTVSYILKTRLPYPWDFCRLNFKPTVRLLINSGSYFLVYAAFTLWFIRMVIKKLRYLSGNRISKKDWIMAVGLSITTATQVLWPVILLGFYFITCSFYPWTTALVVVLLNLSISISSLFRVGVRRSQETPQWITEVDISDVEDEQDVESEEHPVRHAVSPKASISSTKALAEEIVSQNIDTAKSIFVPQGPKSPGYINEFYGSITPKTFNFPYEIKYSDENMNTYNRKSSQEKIVLHKSKSSVEKDVPYKRNYSEEINIPYESKPSQKNAAEFKSKSSEEKTIPFKSKSAEETFLPYKQKSSQEKFVPLQGVSSPAKSLSSEKRTLPLKSKSQEEVTEPSKSKTSEEKKSLEKIILPFKSKSSEEETTPVISISSGKYSLSFKSKIPEGITELSKSKTSAENIDPYGRESFEKRTLPYESKSPEETTIRPTSKSSELKSVPHKSEISTETLEEKEQKSAFELGLAVARGVISNITDTMFTSKSVPLLPVSKISYRTVKSRSEDFGKTFSLRTNKRELKTIEEELESLESSCEKTAIPEETFTGRFNGHVAGGVRSYESQQMNQEEITIRPTKKSSELKPVPHKSEISKENVEEKEHKSSFELNVAVDRGVISNITDTMFTSKSMPQLPISKISYRTIKSRSEDSGKTFTLGTTKRELKAIEEEFESLESSREEKTVPKETFTGRFNGQVAGGVRNYEYQQMSPEEIIITPKSKSSEFKPIPHKSEISKENLKENEQKSAFELSLAVARGVISNITDTMFTSKSMPQLPVSKISYRTIKSRSEDSGKTFTLGTTKRKLKAIEEEFESLESSREETTVPEKSFTGRFNGQVSGGVRNYESQQMNPEEIIIPPKSKSSEFKPIPHKSEISKENLEENEQKSAFELGLAVARGVISNITDTMFTSKSEPLLPVPKISYRTIKSISEDSGKSFTSGTSKRELKAIEEEFESLESSREETTVPEKTFTGRLKGQVAGGVRNSESRQTIPEEITIPPKSNSSELKPIPHKSEISKETLDEKEQKSAFELGLEVARGVIGNITKTMFTSKSEPQLPVSKISYRTIKSISEDSGKSFTFGTSKRELKAIEEEFESLESSREETTVPQETFTGRLNGQVAGGVRNYDSRQMNLEEISIPSESKSSELKPIRHKSEVSKETLEEKEQKSAFELGLAVARGVISNITDTMFTSKSVPLLPVSKISYRTVKSRSEDSGKTFSLGTTKRKLKTIEEEFEPLESSREETTVPEETFPGRTDVQVTGGVRNIESRQNGESSQFSEEEEMTRRSSVRRSETENKNAPQTMDSSD